MRAAVAYYRVSTAQQGRTGLGVEAQRAAVECFMAREGLELIAEHVEVETGKGCDALDRRPVLREALAQAKRAKAAVVAAKLDRLSRDVHFSLA
jgi:DNA invertase Pin-like site-specific DNA recombinase